jgi:hypothetical protein
LEPPPSTQHTFSALRVATLLNSHHEDFSAEKRALIVETYLYFEAEKARGLDPLNRRIRQRVAECMNVGEASVSRVMEEYRLSNSNSPLVSLAADALPVDSPDENYNVIFTDILHSRNLQGLPTIAVHPKAEILATRGVRLTTKFILRQHRKMNCSYIKGRKRDPRADEAGTVNYPSQYLAKKAVNYNWKKSEDFLDESYCNKNHVSDRSWRLPDRVR